MEVSIISNSHPLQRLDNASTGSSVAALRAGITPKMSPVNTPTPTAALIAQTGIVTGKLGYTLRLIHTPISAKIIPNIEPINDKIADSERKRRKIWLRGAPMAFIKPISVLR